MYVFSVGLHVKKLTITDTGRVLLKREISLGRHPGQNAGLDAAVILPAQNLESAMVAPVFAPGVGDQPVRSAMLHTPTKNP